MTARLRIFFDGGCRPNPGRMEIAVVARGVADVRRDIGQGDSHTAEWLALIAAARLAAGSGADDPELRGDALAIIRIANGEAHAQAIDAPHLTEYRTTIAAMPKLRLRHIARAQNLAGIALAKGHPR